MTRNRLRASLTCAALTCTTMPSFAVAEDASTLDRIVVTATRSDTTEAELPLHATVVTAAQIAASPAQTLDQLLRNVSGLLVSGAPAFTTDPTGANIKLRGLDKKVLVLVDGVPVLDPFYTTIQWFKVPLSAIARIEIVRGGGSALWGNLAVAGVINVVTKRPDGDATEAAIRYGSFGTTVASASRDVAFADGLRMRVSVDGFRSRGYDTAPVASRAAFWPGRGDSGAKSGNVRLGLFFDPNEAWSGFVDVGYHEQNEDIGGYFYGGNLQRGPDARAGLTRYLGDAGKLTANAYAQHVRFDKFNGAGCYVAATYACGAPVAGAGATIVQQGGPTLQYATSRDLNTYRERGGSLVYAITREGLVDAVELGIDFRGISGEDAQQTFRTPTAALPAVQRLQRINHGRGAQDFTGAFAQLGLRPLPALAITLDARFDRFGSAHGAADQTNFSNTATPVAAAPLVADVPDQTKTAFDPSLSAHYALGETVALRGSIYRGFRAPGLNNLYRSFGSNAITVANPLLGPETLHGKEVGIDWRTDGIVVGATLYRADVSHVVATSAITTASTVPAAVRAICGSDYIGAPNTLCPGTVSFYTNGQDQRATGVELDGRFALSRAIDVAGYATWTRTTYTRTATGDPTGVQLPLVPRYVAGASATWRADDRWTHAIDVRFSSAMTLSNLTIAPTVRQAAFTVVGVSTQLAVDPHVSLYASLTNAFDRRYGDAAANNPQSLVEAAPRAVTVGLRARY